MTTSSRSSEKKETYRAAELDVLQRNPPFVTKEMDTVPSAQLEVLLCRMGCILLFTVNICLSHGALSQKEAFFPFSPFLPVILWRPFIFCMPCLVKLSLISFLNGTTTLPFHLRHHNDYGLFGKTSKLPISLKARLAVSLSLYSMSHPKSYACSKKLRVS